MKASSPKVSKSEVLEAVARQRARTVALARSLTPQQWESIILPGWRTREVLGHLIASDAGGLTGRMLFVGLRNRGDGGIAAIEAWNEKVVRSWSERPVEKLIAGLEAWGRRIGRVFKATPAAILNRRIPMPFGKVPILWLGQVRVLDEWIHEQDIRRALSLPPDHDAAAVVAAARMMLDVIPQQTPPRMPAGQRGRVALRIDGIDLPPYVADLAARTVGFGRHVDGAAAEPDATITADPAVLMMVASGRDPWRDAEQTGAIKIEGTRAAAEVFLDALRAA